MLGTEYAGTHQNSQNFSFIGLGVILGQPTPLFKVHDT